MNPSPTRHAVVVGLFVAFALAILAGGVLTIGNLNDTFTHKVTVTSVFNEVNGLKKGDNIWFSGLKVGTVYQLSFVGGAAVEVTLKIDQEATPYIHNDALAKISSDGLIGNRIVVLFEGTDKAPVVKDGDVLAVGDTVSTEAIMVMLQTNNTNLLAITSDLKGITGKLAAGEGTIGRLLKDDALYTSVSATVDTLKVASENARTLTASLSTFSAKLNKPGALPNDLVTDRTSYTSLTDTVARLHHVGERASEVMDGVAQGAADPKTPVGIILHDGAAGADIQATLANLHRGSALLNEDLEALQHNILLRGFFKKRDKAAASVGAATDR